MRYYLHLAYNGTAYRGWQRQPNVISVQEVVEKAISKVLKQTIICIGCGRTDAGVHASQYILHIDIKKEIHPEFLPQINHTLPSDIVVYDYQFINGNPHAQFDAYERSYDYFFHIRKTPFINSFSGYYPVESLDIEKMKKAVSMISKNNDFEFFCKTPNKYDHTLCAIKSCTISQNEFNFHFQITANRFLRGMIRILMDRIILVGKGELSLNLFQDYLLRKEKPKFINYAPAEGLFLSRIKYSFLDFEPKEKFIF